MFLKKLQVLSFKSWEEGSFEFSPKLNCFVGLNGSGKTNLLDAIHYLSLSKSYFGSTDVQNIKDEAGYFMVEGLFSKNDIIDTIQCSMKRGQKKILRKNKKEYERLADHIGNYPSVVISPYDRDLITESSETRRRFMDSVISQGDADYLFNLMRYNKTLQQRNTLLKYFAANHFFDLENLEVYNEQLEIYATSIFNKRKWFVESLTPKIRHYYKLISAGSEEALISYDSQLHNADYKKQLEQALDKDRVNQYTGVGVHRDNLVFDLNGKSVRKFGSQGQQKSFLIALKLAQYDYIKEKQGVVPILLLDDIFDKLDEKRVEMLVKMVHDEDFGQIFITDTHLDRTESVVKEIDENAKIFNI